MCKYSERLIDVDVHSWTEIGCIYGLFTFERSSELITMSHIVWISILSILIVSYPVKIKIN